MAYVYVNSTFFVCSCLVQLRGGCSAAFGTEVAQGGEALGVVAEVAQTTGVDFDALAMEIRRCVAAEHGASLETVRLLRPRCGGHVRDVIFSFYVILNIQFSS